MSGSAQVNAKLMAWAKMTEKALEAAMDSHIKESANYAKSNKNWNDRSGSATAGLEGNTDGQATAIKSSIGHHVEHGVFLEKAYFFQGKYRIIEEARSNNLVGLWARLRGIMSGAGFVR